MVCLACSTVVSGHLCSRCRTSLRPGTDRLLAGGIRVVAAFSHEGAARRLVHLLKYGGVLLFAEMAAESLAGRLPDLPLVPVPRAVSRRIRYGVDPAQEIARAISRRTGQPIIPVLAPRLHTERRAGRRHDGPKTRFRVRSTPVNEVILVDDVLTTGATLLEAAASLGADRTRMAAVANSAIKVSSLSDS